MKFGGFSIAASVCLRVVLSKRVIYVSKQTSRIPTTHWVLQTALPAFFSKLKTNGSHPNGLVIDVACEHKQSLFQALRWHETLYDPPVCTWQCPVLSIGNQKPKVTRKRAPTHPAPWSFYTDASRLLVLTVIIWGSMLWLCHFCGDLVVVGQQLINP